MRVIIQDVEQTKSLIKQITGQRIKLRVNRGRNKIEFLTGAIESTYPRIFTFRSDSGTLNSFSYSDILSKQVTVTKLVK